MMVKKMELKEWDDPAARMAVNGIHLRLSRESVSGESR